MLGPRAGATPVDGARLDPKRDHVSHGNAPGPERRRAVRHAVHGAAPAGLMTSSSVRIVDISAGGVLVASPRSAPIGTRGRLSLNLAGSPFSADVVIRRVVAATGQGGFRLGMMFVDITPEQRLTIERFAQS